MGRKKVLNDSLGKYECCVGVEGNGVRQNRKNDYSEKRQVSSLKRVDASRYRRRHARRFISTTMVAMIGSGAH